MIVTACFRRQRSDTWLDRARLLATDALGGRNISWSGGSMGVGGWGDRAQNEVLAPPACPFLVLISSTLGLVRGMKRSALQLCKEVWRFGYQRNGIIGFLVQTSLGGLQSPRPVFQIVLDGKLSRGGVMFAWS